MVKSNYLHNLLIDIICDNKQMLENSLIINYTHNKKNAQNS